MSEDSEDSESRAEMDRLDEESVRGEAINIDTAKSLPSEQIKPGLKIKGRYPPFGGRWQYDPMADEITLIEPPTKDV